MCVCVCMGTIESKLTYAFVCVRGCVQIADTVLALHAKGVAVRVITDDGMAKGQGSDIQKFIDAVRANAIETNKRVMCCGMVMSNVAFACVVVMTDGAGHPSARRQCADVHAQQSASIAQIVLDATCASYVPVTLSNRMLCALPVVLHH